MKNGLRTLDDLYEFCSTKKRAIHFSCSKPDDEPLVVQTDGIMQFEENEEDESPDGLLAVSFQHALHTGENLNHSYISKEVMEEKLLPTFVNRPILGYIHYIDDVPYFKGHEMHEDPETDEIVYDEAPVGIVPETNNAKMVYDEDNDRYNVVVDGYIFEEYSKAAEIIQREGECAVSVEIAIKEMSFSPKEGTLVIEDGYFSGITILGKDDNGNDVRPGMAGSKVTLKDFRANKNSMFNEIDTESALINILEELDNTLSSLYKNYRKEESTAMEDTQVKEEVDAEVETTEEEELETESAAGEEEATVETTVDTEEESQKTPEVADEQEAADDPDEPDEQDESDDAGEDDGSDDAGDAEDDEEPEDEETVETLEDVETTETEEAEQPETFTRTYELSFNDVHKALYELLEPYEEADNDYYWITEIYDDYFIYESGWTGKLFKQGYTKNDDVVEFGGDRVEVYAMYLTQEEKEQIDDMRSNYSAIQTELDSYKANELHEQREQILANADYAAYLETDDFKAIKDNLDTYTLEDLQTKCELAYAKAVHGNKTATFAAEKESKKPKAPLFGFAKVEHDTSFLDGLLKQAKEK